MPVTQEQIKKIKDLFNSENWSDTLQSLSLIETLIDTEVQFKKSWKMSQKDGLSMKITYV